MDWACYLFAKANYHSLHRLQVLQNSSLRICLDAIRTTPINVLHHLAGITTLKIRRFQIASRTLFRNAELYSGSIYPKILFIDKYLPKSNNNCRISRYGIFFDCWKKFKHSLNTIHRAPRLSTFSPSYEGLFIEECSNSDWGRKCHKGRPLSRYTTLIQSLPPNTIIAFTDGSANEDGSRGMGYYIKPSNVTVSLRLPNKFSSTSCELAAVLECMMEPSLPLHSNLIIFSDSLSVISSLQTQGLNSKMHPLVGQIRKKIAKWALINRNFKIYWCPKSFKLSGQVKADKAAKEGCHSAFYSGIKTSLIDVLPQINLYSISDMQNYIHQYGSGLKGR